MPPAKKATQKIEVILDESVPKKHVVRFEKAQKSDVSHHAEHGISPVYISNAAHEKLGSPDKVKVTIESAS